MFYGATEVLLLFHESNLDTYSMDMLHGAYVVQSSSMDLLCRHTPQLCAIDTLWAYFTTMLGCCALSEYSVGTLH